MQHACLTRKPKFSCTFFLNVTVCPARELIYQVLSGNECWDLSAGNELASLCTCSCLNYESLCSTALHCPFGAVRSWRGACAMRQQDRFARGQMTCLRCRRCCLLEKATGAGGHSEITTGVTSGGGIFLSQDKGGLRAALSITMSKAQQAALQRGNARGMVVLRVLTNVGFHSHSTMTKSKAANAKGILSSHLGLRVLHLNG